MSLPDNFMPWHDSQLFSEIDWPRWLCASL